MKFSVLRELALVGILGVLFTSGIFAQSTSNPLADKVLNTCQKVTDENRIAGNFPTDSSASLPIGIAKTIAGTSYVIAVDEAHFYPDRATCNAYMAIDLPGTMDKIAFAAQNIGVNPKGVMSANNSRLVLVSEHHIKINSNVTLILKADGSNYVDWDCNGFKSVNLKGVFEFEDTFLVPDSTSALGTKKVTASFELHTDDIHNFVVQVNMSPFTLKGLKDVSFMVTDATVDLSEISNAPNMVFPKGYQLNGSDEQWTGFYVRNFTVKLPKAISQKNQGRTSFYANNMVIDNSGVSGVFGAKNILSYEQSDLGGWQFSIEDINISLAQSHLNGGGLTGGIKMPMFEDNALLYNATLEENIASKELDYKFIVSTQNGLKANVFSATVDLYSTSKIILARTNGKFVPSADLTGQIKLNSSSASTGKLDFQNIFITSSAPYVTAGTLSFTTANADENKMGKYPITFNKIELNFSQTAPSLYFQVGVNFMKADDQGFAAVAGFRVMTLIDANKKWKYDRVKIDDILLKVTTQAFTIEGKIEFRQNHPVYGNGFAGRVALGLTAINFSAEINTIFGVKDDFKYFYVDGTLQLPMPVVIASGVSLYRFMGGLYYHMKQPAGNEGNLYTSVFTSGKSPDYVPDKSIGLGFKAGVTVGLSGKEDAFNADVGLEVQFNSPEAGGGLSLIKFSGDCFLMTSIQDRQGKTYTQVPVGAQVIMAYDFNNKIFDAILNVGINYEDVAGKVNSVIHFEPKTWYVYVGKPSARGYVSAYGFTMDAYFMVGNKIEPMPDLPSPIGDKFGKPNSRDNGAIESGKGFATGASFHFDAENAIGFSAFEAYGNVGGTVGFDLMMLKVSPGYVCPNTQSTPGFKGWFIRGQVYAYFYANVGIRGKYKGIEFDYNVLKASAIAALYGELMRPSYIRGYVECEFSFFMGAFSKQFNFDFERGTKCG